MSSAPYPVHIPGSASSTRSPCAPPSYQPSLTLKLPTSRIDIHVSCRNLPDKDVLSKSDPFVVLFVEKCSGSDKVWHEIGRTEVVKDCLNPDFVTSFMVEYRFEEIQKLKFSVYDEDSESKNLSDHDFLGSCECTLGSLVGENRGKIERQIVANGRVAGVIVLTGEEVSGCKEIYKVQFRGRKLDKKDFFGRSDPFLLIYRTNEDNSFTSVHKTEIIKNTLNPTWKPFEIHSRKLCNGDFYRTIKIDCYDWDSDGGHDFIGSCTTNVQELKEKGTGCSFELINQKKKKKKKKYQNSGWLEIVNFAVEVETSFLDYLHQGLELCFSVAIDFTASNGDPTLPSSLHFLSPNQPNQYVQALSSVGCICQDYDTDKLFPAFGFGARVPPTYQVMHQFCLNGTSDPYCVGVQGILEAYYRTVQVVQLYGPTNFAPVLRDTAGLASKSAAAEPGKRYFILLIVTDGIITDIEQTKEAIVAASSLPMSIIIVGVGPADFDTMEELDGDVVRLSYKGRMAERDIVQFVPFRNFVNSSLVMNAALASEVLAELPYQITSYMKSRGFRPS